MTRTSQGLVEKKGFPQLDSTGMPRKPGHGSSAERGRKKRLCDMNWADSKKCECCEAEGTDKAQIISLQGVERGKEQDPRCGRNV